MRESRDDTQNCCYIAPMFEAKFQTFEDRSEGAATAPRLAALRTELARRGLTGLIVPHADRQQNEYVPPSEQRLAWLTGFSGSAGVAIVLLEQAVPFVDGRYTVQAREQLDTSLFEIAHLVDTPPEQLIEAAGCSDMLKGTVKPMCSSGRSGSLVGEGNSAAKAGTGDTGDST